MAVKSAQRHTDGDREVVFFSDLAGETGSKGSLIVFRITELLDPERTEYNWHAPVVGDILVVESDERPELDGKVLRSIEVRFAPTWTLRGQAKPGDDVKRIRDIPEGDNEVGDDVIARVKKIKGRSPNGFIAVDEPTAAEHKQALKAMKDAGGDDWPAKGEPARSSDAAKAAGDSEPPF